MLEIWGRNSSSNVQKVLWCCDELGLEYKRYDVGRGFGGTDTPAYLAMNPNGLIPVIKDGDLVIWESNAILRYLASRYGGEALFPAELGQRSEVDRWHDWELGTLAPAIFPVFWGLIRTPVAERNETAIAAAVKTLSGLWGVLDRHLRDNPHPACGRLTLSDIALGNSIYRWFAFPIERPDMPGLRDWYDRISQRPGFVTHIAKPLV